MTTRVSVDSNVGEVIDSINDVKHDLRYELKKRVGAAMDVLWQDARQYVKKDPDTTSHLMNAVKRDESTTGGTLTFRVRADMTMAPYASIVEFGSGSRTGIPYKGGNSIPASWPDVGSSMPKDMPYESPDINHKMTNPAQTEGYPKFYGFVKHIEEWMRAKPVAPESGSYFISAAYIASAIIRRGQHAHPFLRPAWFDNRLEIKQSAKTALDKATE